MRHTKPSSSAPRPKRQPKGVCRLPTGGVEWMTLPSGGSATDVKGINIYLSGG